MAILPSSTYVFDQPADVDTISTRIVARRRMCTGLEALVTNMGLIGLDFAGTSLGGFKRLVRAGPNDAHDADWTNREAMIALQSNRLRLATFVSACVLGVHGVRNHTSLEGLLHPTLEHIYGWFEIQPGYLSLGPGDLERLRPWLARRQHGRRPPAIGLDIVVEGLALADRLLAAAPTYAVADPVAMVAMAFQATVLHGNQHAGASLALSAVVLEAALQEVVVGIGLVEGATARLTPKLPITRKLLTRGEMKKMGFAGLTDLLLETQVISKSLALRIGEVRTARNELMHDAQEPVPNTSGAAINTVRDVMRLATGEHGFELNTGFAWRE
ncbi:MAG: hypothetical protein QM608_21310 [Caulobacter sp.]